MLINISTHIILFYFRHIIIFKKGHYRSIKYKTIYVVLPNIIVSIK